MNINIFKIKNKFQKNLKELDYWKRQKNNENKLRNDHFEYFYTKFFNIEKEWYTDKKILDIGCGPRGSLEWADNASERIGIDPLINDYKELGISKHKARYVECGAESMPFQNSYFDAVFSFNSLDHVDNLSKTIKEIKRVIKKSGIFLLITEFNHKPTICEPQIFSDKEVINKFLPAFSLLSKRTVPKEGRIYLNLLASKQLKRYNKEDALPGVLIAKFIKN